MSEAIDKTTEVLNGLADEADKILKNLNEAERRVDTAAPHYTKLQEVKLQAMQFRLNVLDFQPIIDPRDLDFPPKAEAKKK